LRLVRLAFDKSALGIEVPLAEGIAFLWGFILAVWLFFKNGEARGFAFQ
jgi:hypothetical protein